MCHAEACVFFLNPASFATGNRDDRDQKDAGSSGNPRLT
jgi:hypothetical protein